MRSSSMPRSIPMHAPSSGPPSLKLRRTTFSPSRGRRDALVLRHHAMRESVGGRARRASCGAQRKFVVRFAEARLARLFSSRRKREAFEASAMATRRALPLGQTEFLAPRCRQDAGGTSDRRRSPPSCSVNPEPIFRDVRSRQGLAPCLRSRPTRLARPSSRENLGFPSLPEQRSFLSPSPTASRSTASPALVGYRCTGSLPAGDGVVCAHAKPVGLILRGALIGLGFARFCGG